LRGFGASVGTKFSALGVAIGLAFSSTRASNVCSNACCSCFDFNVGSWYGVPVVDGVLLILRPDREVREMSMFGILPCGVKGTLA